MKHLWQSLAEEMNRSLDSSQVDQLESYVGWLTSEAVVGGGIGPGETRRLPTRHIGDSLLFASAMPSVPKEIVDLGSGVGLPGIPLAILFPGTPVTLVDRSGRRVDLMKRVLRILDLENVEVEHGEIAELDLRAEVVVSRATLPPDHTLVTMNRLVEAGGVGILGGSWTDRPSPTGWETIEIFSEVLDQLLWILIMRRQ